MPPALGAQSLSHRPTREVPTLRALGGLGFIATSPQPTVTLLIGPTVLLQVSTGLPESSLSPAKSVPVVPKADQSKALLSKIGHALNPAEPRESWMRPGESWSADNSGDHRLGKA